MASYHSDDELEEWNQFKSSFNKTYGADEEQRRLKIFLDNKNYIESYNTKSQASFKQGINALSDLTTEEINLSRNGFRLGQQAIFASSDDVGSQIIPAESLQTSNLLQQLLEVFDEFSRTTGRAGHSGGGGGSGLDRVRAIYAEERNSTATKTSTTFMANKTPPPPTTTTRRRNQVEQDRSWVEDLLTRPRLDYRDMGRVSRVKDQGSCGSCWAFATTGAIEGILASQNRSILLSEQNLVDCSSRYGNKGCSGGLMDAALRYVRDYGIMSGKDYPYKGEDGTCKASRDKIVTRVRGCMLLPRGNEPLLRVALALTGPIPVAIDASARSFHSYKSGVYDDHTSCSSSARNLNHAVLLVGYGTQKNGPDYWILKNSWGKSWGDNGYIKLARNRRNLCGVASYAVLPLP